MKCNRGNIGFKGSGIKHRRHFVRRKITPKRISVFAGPNGSGKTTMVEKVIKNGLQQGLEVIKPNRHINPDYFNSIDFLYFNKFGLTVEESDFRRSMLCSPFYEECGIESEDFLINNNCFIVPKKNSYLGAMLAEYIKDCYIKSEERMFSFETVFSHPSKVDFLKNAEDKGWDVYLYFVSTEDPEINCARVKDRVLKKGHDVPPEKIVSRYKRSLDNLFPAFQCCTKAFIFDNTVEMRLVAEKKLNGSLELNETIPAWLDDYLLSKL